MRLDGKLVLANAGINGVWAPLEELSVEDWRQTIDVNLTGTFITVKHATPLLKRQGGSVILTSSINGTRTFSNIDDNTGERDTDEAGVPVEFPEGSIPLTGGKPGSSEQVADLVLFLASDASSHINGTEVWIDSRQSLLV